jgi:hypothetical protein
MAARVYQMDDFPGFWPMRIQAIWRDMRYTVGISALLSCRTVRTRKADGQ